MNSGDDFPLLELKILPKSLWGLLSHTVQSLQEDIQGILELKFDLDVKDIPGNPFGEFLVKISLFTSP